LRISSYVVIYNHNAEQPVINDVNDETKEIRAMILAANKAYSSLQTIFRSKQLFYFILGTPVSEDITKNTGDIIQEDDV
jgi:hypothetical protein